MADTERAMAEVAIPQDTAWKLFTRWIPAMDALRESDVRGETTLAHRMFDTTAVIA